jgi:integrase
MPLCCGDPEKPDAFKLFIAAKTKDGRRPDTIRNLSDRVGRFCKQHPTKLVSDIAQHDIEAFIDSGKKAYYGKLTDRLALSSFFSWCASKKFCVSNPAQHVPKPKHDKPEPQIIPLDRVRRLVEAAMKYKKGVCLPYVALGLFCAIRPREVSRLSWNNIDLTDATISIDAAAAKKRQKRVVTIPDNAVEFLLKHATKRTPLVGKNWRRDFRAVKKLAGYGTPDAKNGLTAYPPDAMRHTGISHHLATPENETKTAAWAGNSPDVIHTSYKALVKPKEAADFWAITPRAMKRKVVQLKVAA